MKSYIRRKYLNDVNDFSFREGKFQFSYLKEACFLLYAHLITEGTNFKILVSGHDVRSIHWHTFETLEIQQY